jgi:hypothetical protein
VRTARRREQSFCQNRMRQRAGFSDLQISDLRFQIQDSKFKIQKQNARPAYLKVGERRIQLVRLNNSSLKSRYCAG